MTKLVIFDLDGTLLDTLEDLAISTNHALAQNGFPQHDTEAYRFFVGNGITKLMERALPEDQRNEKTVLRVRQDFVDYYSMHNMDYTKPYPGIPELIDDLQKQAPHGCRLEQVSGGHGKIDRPLFSCRHLRRRARPT